MASNAPIDGAVVAAEPTLTQVRIAGYGGQGIVLLRRGLWGVVAGLASVLAVTLLLPLLESLFSVTTDITLLELADLNRPILRRLMLEAPGTYHHSLVVGSLSETGAAAIGGNPLVARVGAYYHDIGKIEKAEYYVTRLHQYGLQATLEQQV